MVIMEFLDSPWRVLNMVTMNTERISRLRENILGSITLLHGNKMVHGDIRDTNVTKMSLCLLISIGQEMKGG